MAAYGLAGVAPGTSSSHASHTLPQCRLVKATSRIVPGTPFIARKIRYVDILSLDKRDEIG